MSEGDSKPETIRRKAVWEKQKECREEGGRKRAQACDVRDVHGKKKRAVCVLTSPWSVRRAASRAFIVKNAMLEMGSAGVNSYIPLFFLQ